MEAAPALTIYEYGDPAGPPILLVHGGAGGVWTWSAVVERLSAYRCLVPELPEHGGSQANGPFSIHATAAGLIDAVRSRVPGGRAHLVGLSVGGQIVVEMLARAPQLALSAVISGALALPLPGYRLGVYSETVMSLIYWLGVRPWRNNDPWIRLNMKLSSGIPPAFFPAFKQNFQSLTLDGWRHAMSEFYRYRLPAGLEQVTAPVLLVAGAHETADAQPTNRLLHGLLPNSRSVLVGADDHLSAAAEHNWSLSLPDLCAQTVAAWVNQTALPAGLSPDPNSNHSH